MTSAGKTEDDPDVATTVMVGGGIQADDMEAASYPDAVFSCPKPCSGRTSLRPTVPAHRRD